MTGLPKPLEDLQIFVGQTREGEVFVYTTAEPLFCFVRSTEAEALDVARDTLVSYTKHFCDRQPKILLVERSAPTVPQVSVEPRRRVTPQLEYA